jgi:GMP synthase (glutamine-hydrolysing)
MRKAGPAKRSGSSSTEPTTLPSKKTISGGALKPILIIKTGSTLNSVPRERGDFEHWIIAAMRLPAAQFVVCDVMAGEQLPSADQISGIVITGSAAMVTDKHAWSEYTGAFLRAAADGELPVLGICYGHQLLAHALGGAVDYHPNGREIGTTGVLLTAAGKTDPLFAELPPEFPVNVSHKQTVTRLPAGAEILAANDFEPHHAVRFSKNMWGVQFHPEFAADIMQIYLAEREPVLLAEGLNVAALQAKVTLTPVAESLLLRFANLACQAT